MKRILWSIMMLGVAALASATAPDAAYAVKTVVLDECEPENCNILATCDIECSECAPVVGSIKGVCSLWP